MDDLTLKEDILEELEFQPGIEAEEIGVSVDGGAVTLSGHVPSDYARMLVETAARRVAGVRVLASEIEVRRAGEHAEADDEIARRIIHVLDWNLAVPKGAIQATVRAGRVTLTGEVDWHRQRVAAEKAVRKLRGVAGIENRVTIRPRPTAIDVRQHVESALRRDAQIDSGSVRILVEGGLVVLEGELGSWSECVAAERAAWATPGVEAVDDRLTIAGC